MLFRTDAEHMNDQQADCMCYVYTHYFRSSQQA